MKILAIDDDQEILQVIHSQLQKKKWEVATAQSYEEAKKKIFAKKFDMVICDYRISEKIHAKQGLDLIQEIRDKKIKIPVIFLTGKNLDEITPWDALNVGVDDFMKKPWREEELVARVQAVYRRSPSTKQGPANIVKYSDVTLDLDLQKIKVGRSQRYLGSILTLLLQKFLEEPDILHTYETLISHVWGKQKTKIPLAEQLNKLRVHMAHLKKEVGKGASTHLHTVHRAGYVWETNPKKRTRKTKAAAKETPSTT